MPAPMTAVLFAVIICLAGCCYGADAFAPSYNVGRRTIMRTLYESSGNNNEQTSSPYVRAISRREALQRVIGAYYVMMIPSLASASNLPGSTGADLSKTGSVDTIIPIVAIQRSISNTKQQLSDSTVVSPSLCATTLQTLLKSIPREENAFKRIFDAYSTPVNYKQKFLDQNAFLVYYTKGFDGPGRSNIEEDVNTVQTQQYGFRNEAWTAVDDLFVELEFGKGSTDDSAASSKEELVTLVDKVLIALDSYLSLAPANELEEAKRRLGK